MAAKDKFILSTLMTMTIEMIEMVDRLEAHINSIASLMKQENSINDDIGSFDREFDSFLAQYHHEIRNAPGESDYNQRLGQIVGLKQYTTRLLDILKRKFADSHEPLENTGVTFTSSIRRLK